MTSICDYCKRPMDDSVHSRPGKFEGSPCQVHAERLYQVSLDGGCDEESGDVESYVWFGLIGSDILTNDSQGFVTFRSFDDPQPAKQEYDLIEQEYLSILDKDQKERSL